MDNPPHSAATTTDSSASALLKRAHESHHRWSSDFGGLAARDRGIGNARGAVARHVIIVVLALQLEPAASDFQPLRVAASEVGADLGEQVLLNRVGQRA